LNIRVLDEIRFQYGLGNGERICTCFLRKTLGGLRWFLSGNFRGFLR